MQGMRIWVAVVAVLTGLGREIEIVIERVLEDLPGVGRGSRSLRSALTSGLTQPPAKRLGSVHDIIQNFSPSIIPQYHHLHQHLHPQHPNPASHIQYLHAQLFYHV